MNTPGRAYGFARVSAMKSTLLTPEDVVAIRCTTDARASDRAAAALEIDEEPKRFARLISRYRSVLRAYVEADPIIRRMLQLHEVENVKLAWRAAIRKIEAARWQPLLRNLEELATIDAARLGSANTLYEVAQSLARTPFEEVAESVLGAHGDDLAAAELAFDRWASVRLLDSVSLMGEAEHLARDIIIELVRERDDELAARGVIAYGLSPEAAAAARALGSFPPPRRDLIRLCRRAFVGQSLRLAPAVAYMVFAERDYRLSIALAERRGSAELDPLLDRIAARSAAG
jgi:hypothetical protein